MKDTLVQPTVVDSPISPPARSGWYNLLKYIARRSAILLVTVVVAVYTIILVVNFGGYVDEIIKARIEFSLGGMLRAGWLRDESPEDREAIIDQTRAAMWEAEGLNKPFMLRSLNWLWDGLTLNWGKVDRPHLYGSSANSAGVRELILDNLSRSLFMFGLAYVVLFGLAVFLALALNRQYGRWFDKLFVLLSPLSSAPAWVYGVILSVIFLRAFTFSTGGTFDAWPEGFQLAHLPLLLRRMSLPFLAIVISGLFLTVNSWRTYFLVYSSEDYVEMARAKGLSDRQIERSYILRPALPGLLTSFALMTIVLWQEVIVLEYIFNVAGIGRVFVVALQASDTPVLVGLVVMFAYLLALTVLLLDILYAFVDPRVKVGASEQSGSLAVERGKSHGRSFFHFPTIKFTLPSLPSPGQLAAALGQQARAAWGVVRQLAEYPTAVFGLIVIALFVGVAIYTVIAIPYHQAIADWRGDNGVWARNPEDAQPAWVNFFRRDKLPETIVLNSQDPAITKQTAVFSEGQTEITFTFAFDYPYSAPPQELAVYFTSQFREKLPFVTLTWINPLGQATEIASMAVENEATFYFSRNRRLQRRLRSDYPQEALFVDREAEEDTAVILPGPYQLQVSALIFEPDGNVDAEFVLFGQVHGLAGTDSNRRDLSLALLWGTPIALAFGLVAAVVTSLASMLLAALGAWYGGWVDRLVQFFTEINLLLPFLAVTLMVCTLYSRSIWAILGVTILLNIFSHSIKTYRAVFLQIKESAYMEAARAYGASDGRLVVRYLMPRVLPILLPKLIILVPSFVFLEATLAYLGVSDPVLPTWGKLVVDALSSGVYREAYHLVLAPFILLFLVGFAFALVGLALERIFDPRLREM